MGVDDKKLTDSSNKDIDLSAIKNAADETTQSLNGVAEANKNVSGSGANAEETLKKIKDALIGTTTGADSLSSWLNKAISGLGTFGTAIQQSFEFITSGFDFVIKKANEFPSAMAASSETMRSAFNPISPDRIFSPGFDKAMKDLILIQSPVRAGFVRIGEGIDRANEAATAYPNTLRRMSAAYAVNSDELNKMYSSLQGIPMILNQTGEVTQDVTVAQQKMVGQLGALTQISKTFGMSADEATQRAQRGYKEFNQTVEDTVKSMASISDAARQTGVDRKIADEQIVTSSASLSIFGQKSDAAAGTWLTFTKALKDTVPIQQVGNLVKEVTDRIAGMAVQNRAFISMMSGMTQGKSALGGALQMELALRSPDGMEKHLNALTSTLSQFAGGKIITLEEAARNPQMEIQFQLQREMLGKLAGISDAQQQNRVLEVLKGVQSGGMSAVDASKEMTKLQEEGTTVQEKQLTALERSEQVLKVGFADLLNWDVQIEGIDEFVRQRSESKDYNQNPEYIFGKSLEQMSPKQSVATNAFSYLGTQAANITGLQGGDRLDGAKTDFIKSMQVITGVVSAAYSTQKDILSGKGLTKKEVVTPRAPGTARRVQVTKEEDSRKRVSVTANKETLSAFASAGETQTTAAIKQNVAASTNLVAANKIYDVVSGINLTGGKTREVEKLPEVSKESPLTTPTPMPPVAPPIAPPDVTPLVSQNVIPPIPPAALPTTPVLLGAPPQIFPNKITPNEIPPAAKGPYMNFAGIPPTENNKNIIRDAKAIPPTKESVTKLETIGDRENGIVTHTLEIIIKDDKNNELSRQFAKLSKESEELGQTMINLEKSRIGVR